MGKEAIDFIKDNLNLIDSNDFGKFYLNVPLNYRGDVTSLLLEADIDPLKYTDSVPAHYLGYQDNIESINIPDNIKSIGVQAFLNCSSLTHVTIGDSVTSIGKYAFKGCSKLTSITIPDSVTGIGYGTFSGCTSLKTLNYNGTKSQWNAADLHSIWKDDSLLETIHCIDGDIEI